MVCCIHTKQYEEGMDSDRQGIGPPYVETSVCLANINKYHILLICITQLQQEQEEN